MKRSSGWHTSLFALAVFATASSGALADKSYNASHSNTANIAAAPAPAGTSCPTGQAWNATAKKCVLTDSVNYNASKSNTGNVTYRGTGGAGGVHGARATSSPRYHCGHNEYMLQNGDCVPNPPSKPND
jgi:hypothetical protein